MVVVFIISIIIIIIMIIIIVIIIIIIVVVVVVVVVVIVTLLVQHAHVDSQITLSTFNQKTGLEASLPELFGLTEHFRFNLLLRDYQNIKTKPSTVERHQPTG